MILNMSSDAIMKNERSSLIYFTLNLRNKTMNLSFNRTYVFMITWELEDDITMLKLIFISLYDTHTWRNHVVL